MPLTAQQIQDVRDDIGDSTNTFTDDEIQRLSTRTGGNHTHTCYLAVRQLTMNATKLANYTIGKTRQERRQVFENLKAMLDMWKAELDADASNAKKVVMARSSPSRKPPKPDTDPFAR